MMRIILSPPPKKKCSLDIYLHTILSILYIMTVGCVGAVQLERRSRYVGLQAIKVDQFFKP